MAKAKLEPPRTKRTCVRLNVRIGFVRKITLIMVGSVNPPNAPRGFFVWGTLKTDHLKAPHFVNL
jgi:hypothetical protein